MKDLTGEYDYERMVREEKSEFDGQAPPDLLANKLEDCAAWTYYWQRTARTIASRENSNVVSLLERGRTSADGPLRILGLGSGYCGAELRLAERFSTEFVMTCTDLNPLMFEKAGKIAEERGWRFEFQEQDLNFIEIKTRALPVLMERQKHIGHRLGFEPPRASRARQGLSRCG